MDFKFQVMEMSLIKHKYERSQKVAITASEFAKSLHCRNASSPLRGDSTRPLNIYGTTEIQIAVCDFLSSSLPLLAVFREGFSLTLDDHNDILLQTLMQRLKNVFLELCIYLHI